MRAGRNGDQPAQTVGGGAVELRTREARRPLLPRAVPRAAAPARPLDPHGASHMGPLCQVRTRAWAQVIPSLPRKNVPLLKKGLGFG